MIDEFQIIKALARKFSKKALDRVYLNPLLNQASAPLAKSSISVVRISSHFSVSPVRKFCLSENFRPSRSEFDDELASLADKVNNYYYKQFKNAQLKIVKLLISQFEILNLFFRTINHSLLKPYINFNTLPAAATTNIPKSFIFALIEICSVFSE